MPVIVDPDAFNVWLNPATPVTNLKGLLLGRNLDGNMVMHRVSRGVNSSRFTGQPAPIVNSL